VRPVSTRDRARVAHRPRPIPHAAWPARTRACARVHAGGGFYAYDPYYTDGDKAFGFTGGLRRDSAHPDPAELVFAMRAYAQTTYVKGGSRLPSS